MQQLRVLRTLFCLLAVALPARNAHAFCRTMSGDPNANGCSTDGFPLYWKSDCVGIHLDQAASVHVSLEDARSLVVDGFAAWIAAAGACAPSITIVPLEPVARPKIGFDDKGTNENDVVFHDDVWPYEVPVETVELVTLTFHKATGEILDGDIEINGTVLAPLLAQTDGGISDPASSNALRRVFMHAAGHFLGFSHSSDPTSIMVSSIFAGDDSPPELNADDAAGMCTVYPPNGERPALDSNGRPLLVPATGCALTTPTSVGSCSGGTPHIDHGCSIGTRARAPRKEALSLLGAGLFSVLSLRARRRRPLCAKR